MMTNSWQDKKNSPPNLGQGMPLLQSLSASSPVGSLLTPVTPPPASLGSGDLPTEKFVAVMRQYMSAAAEQGRSDYAQMQPFICFPPLVSSEPSLSEPYQLPTLPLAPCAAPDLAQAQAQAQAQQKLHQYGQQWGTRNSPSPSDGMVASSPQHSMGHLVERMLWEVSERALVAEQRALLVERTAARSKEDALLLMERLQAALLLQIREAEERAAISEQRVQQLQAELLAAKSSLCGFQGAMAPPPPLNSDPPAQRDRTTGDGDAATGHLPGAVHAEPLEGGRRGGPVGHTGQTVSTGRDGRECDMVATFLRIVSGHRADMGPTTPSLLPEDQGPARLAVGADCYASKALALRQQPSLSQIKPSLGRAEDGGGPAEAEAGAGNEQPEAQQTATPFMKEHREEHVSEEAEPLLKPREEGTATNCATSRSEVGAAPLSVHSPSKAGTTKAVAASTQKPEMPRCTGGTALAGSDDVANLQSAGEGMGPDKGKLTLLSEHNALLSNMVKVETCHDDASSRGHAGTGALDGSLSEDVGCEDKGLRSGCRTCTGAEGSVANAAGSHDPEHGELGKVLEACAGGTASKGDGTAVKARNLLAQKDRDGFARQCPKANIEQQEASWTPGADGMCLDGAAAEGQAEAGGRRDTAKGWAESGLQADSEIMAAPGEPERSNLAGPAGTKRPSSRDTLEEDPHSSQNKRFRLEEMEGSADLQQPEVKGEVEQGSCRDEQQVGVVRAEQSEELTDSRKPEEQDIVVQDIEEEGEDEEERLNSSGVTRQSRRLMLGARQLIQLASSRKWQSGVHS